MRSGGKRVEGDVSRARGITLDEIRRMDTKPLTAEEGSAKAQSLYTQADARFAQKFSGAATRRTRGMEGLFRREAGEGRPIRGNTERAYALTFATASGNFAPLIRSLQAYSEAPDRAPISKDELVRVFEMLNEQGSPVVSHPRFRGRLDRDLNLLVNQLIREANGNIAYRTVDFDPTGMEDADVWAKIDSSPHRPELYDNAAAAMLKMAEKLGIEVA